MAIACYHGGLAVTMQKLLASGGTPEAPEPIGGKISVSYGIRLRSAFGDMSAADDILFIPSGDDDMSGAYTEEGTLQDDSGLPAVVTQ